MCDIVLYVVYALISLFVCWMSYVNLLGVIIYTRFGCEP